MYRKELAYYFSTPVAYIVIALYLLIISLALWVIPGNWNILDSGYAQADGLFALAPWLLMLLCPALTMHLFADERRSGNWDVLRSKPISLAHIILAKFFAAWTVVIVAQLPCLLHIVALHLIAEPAGNIDHGALLAGWLNILMLSALDTVAGTAAAFFTRSQITAFLCAAVLCLLLILI